VTSKVRSLARWTFLAEVAVEAESTDALETRSWSDFGRWRILDFVGGPWRAALQTCAPVQARVSVFARVRHWNTAH